MSRMIGGVVGVAVEPSITAASGTWTIEDHIGAKRRALWPLRRRMDVLLNAGGGGGGGGQGSGGGGAGGVLLASVEADPGAYAISIGAGGASASIGSNTTAFGLVAFGGGLGGSGQFGEGSDGGSGGGAGWERRRSGAGVPGQGTTPLHQDGLELISSPAVGGGGFGGPGGVDDLLGAQSIGQGGKGVNLLAIGYASASQWIAGGGGGGQYTGGGAAGSGGSGIGGSGASLNAADVNGGNAAANTGSGGGGASLRINAPNPPTIGAGGSGSGGRVVIRYATGLITASGGTTTTYTFDGVNYTAHTFTSTGTFTIS